MADMYLYMNYSGTFSGALYVKEYPERVNHVVFDATLPHGLVSVSFLR